MNRKFKCIFDTNIFNRILDWKIPDDAFRHQVSAYVTHVQRDEINNTRNDERREALANKFTDIIPDNENIIPTRSAVWGGLNGVNRSGRKMTFVRRSNGISIKETRARRTNSKTR